MPDIIGIDKQRLLEKVLPMEISWILKKRVKVKNFIVSTLIISAFLGAYLENGVKQFKSGKALRSTFE